MPIKLACADGKARRGTLGAHGSSKLDCRGLRFVEITLKYVVRRVALGKNGKSFHSEKDFRYNCD